MKRCVIIGGAEIKNYALMRKYFRPSDFVIYCDCGLKHRENLKVPADLITGDFDTHAIPEDKSNVIILPRVKDDTDTIFAVKEGMRRGFDDFLLMGVTGGRTDHTLGNIYALLMLAKNNKRGVIVDDFCEMKIICSGKTERVKFGWKFFSLLNITGTAKGISITGAKYNLTDAEIDCEFQYGISNEILTPDEDAQIFLREGYLLLVCVR